MPRDRKIVVFDLDGTILASTPFYFSILDKIFHRHQMVLTDEEKALASGLSAKAFLAPRLDESAMNSALDYLKEQSAIDLHHIPVFDGFYGVLETLKLQGRKVAVWTSRDRSSALTLLSRNQLDKFFDVVVAADCVKKHKPDPEGLFAIAEQLGGATADMVMIGDHDVDVMAARAAGVAVIRANWHGYRQGENCRFGALTAHSVNDLTMHLT